jgi:hypothetical protein
MPNPEPTKRSNLSKARPRTSSEIIAEQKEQAAKEKAAKAESQSDRKGSIEPLMGKAAVPARAASAAVALPDNRTSVQKYQDETAPVNIVGRIIKFGKNGTFVTADDDAPVEETAELVALCPEVLVGWIRFHPDEDVPPDRIQGLLYDGFVMPPRAMLGDEDQSEWPQGLDEKPEDPWKHQNCLPLQRVGTAEMFTFVTTSVTGRRAVINLLRHYDRMQRLNPGELPVVRLKPGGFNHRDPRVGWVAVPTFQIVGRSPRDSAITPDTSPGGDMNDSIPI